jgi:hypothetical protein
MRCMARVVIPVEAGNRSISDGTIGKVLQGTAERWRPEAMYFTTHDGQRCAFIIFDLPEASDIPAFAEPLFDAFNAELELLPVMNVEDLQTGLAKLG